MKQINGLTKTEVKRLRRYAAQLHRQCENSCNGVGYIPYKGKFYTGHIDDWVRKEYGFHVQDGIVNDDKTVFDVEIERLEKKIKNIFEQIPNSRVEFQHDPRGWEVRLYVDNVDISEVIH